MTNLDERLMVDKTSREPTLREVSAWLGQEQESAGDPPVWHGLDDEIRGLSREAHWQLVKKVLYLRAMGITAKRESVTRMIADAKATAERRSELAERRHERDTVATVYYLRVGSLIKIGQAADLEERLRAYPPDSILLATEIGERNTLETERVQQFRPYRASHRREWFYPSAELIEHINSLRDEPLKAAELAA